MGDSDGDLPPLVPPTPLQGDLDRDAEGLHEAEAGQSGCFLPESCPSRTREA